jgi:acyl-coenzyme A thioesterase PaaI-like protein
MTMTSVLVPFRLDAAAREASLREFNARAEILWFGMHGRFEEPGLALVTLERLEPGLLGGGGTAALNGGVISAGFDAAVVLAGLGQYASPAVVTLELSVRFLSLARPSPGLAFRARVVRSSRRFAFVEAELSDAGDAASEPCALASAMVAPAVA